jgi:hypothetical protein
MTRRMAVSLVVALITVATFAPTAQAQPGPTLPVSDGVVTHPDGSGFAWRLGVARNDIRGIPGLCLMSDHSWDAAGTSFGNVVAHCFAARVGRRFSLHAAGCRGVAVGFGSGSAGDNRIRKLALALDARARLVRIAFRDGERVTVRTRPAPRALRLKVRVAWRMDTGEAAPRRVVAYGAARKRARQKQPRRRIVGRWQPGRGC